MSELEAVIAEEKAKLVESKKLRMLYLDEEDMIEAGVMDAQSNCRCGAKPMTGKSTGKNQSRDFIYTVDNRYAVKAQITPAAPCADNFGICQFRNVSHNRAASC